MTQLDFKAFSPYCGEDVARRHEAFWGRLDENRRTIARVACDAFCFAAEVNWQLGQVKRHADDLEKRNAAYHLALECATVAMAKFRHFGTLTGCRDDAEMVYKLDRLIEYAEKREWRIVPGWWIDNPARKNTNYFINRLKAYAGERNAWLIQMAKAKREAAEAKRRKKEAEKKAEDDKKGGAQ